MGTGTLRGLRAKGSFDRGAGGYGADNQDTAPRRGERYKTLGKNDFTRLERVLDRAISRRGIARTGFVIT